MNILDKAITYINPRAGLIRASYRKKVRSYDSASYGRRTKMFDHATASGPNLEISGALQTLRNRSREMVRNNGWANRAVNVVAKNVVGEGIRPAPTVGTKNQIKKVKSIWKDWAESVNCDWYGQNTLYGLQLLAMRSIAEGGDCLVIKRRVQPTKENPIPIKIQLLEGDQLDHYKDFGSFQDNSYCRLGVQFSQDGVREGYWIFPTHPTDGTGFFKTVSSVFVPVSDCLHIYELLRIGQVRGVPMGVSSFIKMQDGSDYEDAELLRIKVASLFVAFVEGDEDQGNDPLERMEPGIIEYLKPGQKVTMNGPSTTSGIGEYTKTIKQGVAAGYGITYEMLTMDYSNVNFSSGRMAKIDVTGTFRNLQYNMLVPQMCVPVWGWFMDSAIMAGLMPTRLQCNCMDWTAPRVQQLDPVKETSARVLQIQSGLTTLSECLREDGRDPDDVFEELASDKEKCEKAGITLSTIILPQIIEQNTQKNADEGN